MHNLLTEDFGLIKLHSVCAKMFAIWRPTTSHDLGIDGQIEFLAPGTSTSTGDIIAVQCKSGQSYFHHEDADFVYFNPHPRHRRYWKDLKLPVILVLHNPVNDVTLYAPVKPQLAAGDVIRIKKSDLFAPESRAALQSCCETTSFDPRAVLAKLQGIKLNRDGGKTVTGIEFLLACTNREQSFFELRMCRVSTLLDIVGGAPSFSIGALDYEFILRNAIVFLDNQLTEDFRESFDEQWFDLQLVPDIIVPLNKRGQSVINHLWENLTEYLSAESYQHLGGLGLTGIATTISISAQRESDGLDQSDRLGFEPKNST